MNAERCEFIAGNSLIEVIPSISDDRPIHLISGDIGPFEAGVPCRIPVWTAILMKRKHNCKVVAPQWMDVDELKKILTSETESQGLAKLPDHFFEISHMLVRDAREDIFEVEAVKSLVQDIYDRRDAKLRSSAIEFLRQNQTCHAQLDNVQLIEASSARATLEACRQMGAVVRNKHESTPL